VVALAGMKIAGNASKAANRTGEGLSRLARETVAAHAAADAAGDELFGEGRRGDEVPGEAWRPRSRNSRIAAALASLKAERLAAAAEEEARAEACRAQRQAGERRSWRNWRSGLRPGSPAAAGRPGSMTTAGSGRPRPRWRRRRPRAAEAQRKAAEREATRKGPGPVRNITDPDSRLMPVRGGGFTQGYNTQNMTSGDELIIATELTDDPVDFAWFEPMTSKADASASATCAATRSGSASATCAATRSGSASATCAAACAATRPASASS
jgi:hypothetical protein